MNKKISSLILMSYLGTSVIPTSVYAEELGVLPEDVVLDVTDNTTPVVNENQSSPSDTTPVINENQSTTTENGAISEINKRLSKVTIKYVDSKGAVLATEDTNETLFTSESKDFEFGTAMVSVPKHVTGKYATMVKINGKEFPYTAQVNYGLKAGLEEITIEWVYEDTLPSTMRTTAMALYHNSFFVDVYSPTNNNGILKAFPSGYPMNFNLTNTVYDELKTKIDSSTGVATLISGFPTNLLQLVDDAWVNKIIGHTAFIDSHGFCIPGIADNSRNIDLLTQKDVFSTQSTPKYQVIYAYHADFEKKQLSPAGELHYAGSRGESDSANGFYHTYTDIVRDSLNSVIIYMSEKLNLEEFNNNKTEDESGQLTSENYYTVAEMKDDILTENEGSLQFYYGSDIEHPVLGIELDNIKSVIANLNDSDKVGLSISYGNYTGHAKKFYEENKNSILGLSPSYTGNLKPVNGKFDKANQYSVYISDESIKVGDTLKLHIVSNNSESNDSQVMSSVTNIITSNGVDYREVVFELKEDITDKTLFVVKPDIQLDDPIEKPESKPESKPDSDGLQLRNDKDNYRVNYKYLTEKIGSEGLTFYKGQDFIPGFTLSQANINSILSKVDESYVMSVDINGESYDESPSVLKGISKKFYDLYKNQVYRWVHYKSNLGDKPFEHDNLVAFPLDLKDFKEGDTVYLYTTSNLKGGKVELVKEQKLREELNAGAAYGLVVFDTKIDISDRTFFLTTSKIEISENGQLPDTGGMAVFTMIGGAIAVIAGGSLLFLGKKKK